MYNNKVIISVRGGLAEVVEAPDNVDVYVIDHDNTDAGGCAFCGKEAINDLGLCDNCGLDNNGMEQADALEIVNRHMGIE